MKKFLVILLASLLFISCNKTVVPTEMPEDFNFSLNFVYITISSYDNSIKNYWVEESAGELLSLPFEFTESDMKEIYKSFVENKIYNLPEKLDVKHEQYQFIPPSYCMLTYTLNGETKSVEYTYRNLTMLEKLNVKRFLFFTKAIQSYYIDDEQYKYATKYLPHTE